MRVKECRSLGRSAVVHKLPPGTNYIDFLDDIIWTDGDWQLIDIVDAPPEDVRKWERADFIKRISRTLYHGGTVVIEGADSGRYSLGMSPREIELQIFLLDSFKKKLNDLLEQIRVKVDIPGMDAVLEPRGPDVLAIILSCRLRDT